MYNTVSYYNTSVFFFLLHFPGLYFFANCGPWQQVKYFTSYELGTLSVFILQVKKPKQGEIK